MKKEYLGDGVYVDIIDGMFKLTTEDGISETNTIFLEPSVVAAFDSYVQRAISAARCESVGSGE